MEARRDQQDKVQKKQNDSTSFIFAGVAGVISHSSLHWWDTAIRRIQSSKTPIDSLAQFKRVVFKGAADQGILQKVKSVFQGFGVAGTYATVTRTLRYGGQSHVVDILDGWFGLPMRNHIGESQSKLMVEASAGMVMGIIEPVIFTPLDAIKIKRQTGDQRTIVEILRQERWQIYNGISAAFARNVPGSAAQFSVVAGLKSLYSQYYPQQKMSVLDHFAMATIGAVAAVVITNPQDVLKTRIQSQSGCSMGLFAAAKQVVREEGWATLLTRSLVLRLLNAGPKFALPMAITSILMDEWKKIQEISEPQGNNRPR